MKWPALVWWFLLLFVVLVLQSTVLVKLAPWGMVPDLVLGLVVCTGLRWGYAPGGILGLVAGLLADMTGTSLIGINALSRMLLGFFSGLVVPREFQDAWFLPTAVAFLATLAHELLLALLLMAWVGTGPASWVNFAATLVPLGLMNAMGALVLVRPFLWWERYEARREAALFWANRGSR